jgi:putative ABC transport system permease protein
MSLNVRPIVSSLLRNKTGAVLVALQVAIVLALLANAICIVAQRVAKIERPTGLDVENILVIASTGFTTRFDAVGSLRQDLDYLRGLDGVIAATATNSVPLSGGGYSTELLTNPDTKVSGPIGNSFEVDEQGLAALGVHLIAGRGFRREEILPALTKNNQNQFAQEIIVTRAFAQALFPNGEALGKTVYEVSTRSPATIIGIIDQMYGSFVNRDHPDYVYLMPRLPFSFSGTVYYLVRTRPGRLDGLLSIVAEHLASSNLDRTLDVVRPLQAYKTRSYIPDRVMGIVLTAITVVLLGVAALGIFGLATFSVSVRTKQIGTRRAIGARRVDILQYFMVENALIMTSGIVGGCVLALGIGYWLSAQFAMPRLELNYLLAGVLLLWAVGQLAVWYPAHRASGVSPSVATRTV